MSAVQHIADVVARQAIAAATTTAPTDDTPACEPDNEYDGRMGVRISAIFVILIGSSFGAIFPVFAERHRGVGVPTWAFFIAKYFGSGVIIATAFIHLLAPANDALTDPCLTGPIKDYDWVEGIALMMVFVLFFVELMAMRFATFSAPTADERDRFGSVVMSDRRASEHVPGEDHLGHVRDHPDNPSSTDSPPPKTSKSALDEVFKGQSSLAQENIESGGKGRSAKEIEEYSAQVTAVLILEFGVIFHSIFIGLTLAVAGSEFDTLYVVLVFHQTFEGLGLGSRLAATPWPRSRRFTPYYLAVLYGLTTPISIAVGLGVRSSYAPGSQTALIVNGVFDSLSAGILIYTGLVELMAHEFMFSATMRRAPLWVVLTAVSVMTLGAGLMALLGKWA